MKYMAIGSAIISLALAWSGAALAQDYRKSVDCRKSFDFRFVGADGGDELGVQARFGDLDGDGYDDLILGAYMADGVRSERLSSGEVYVFYGRPGPPRQGDEFLPSVIYGGRPGDRIGSAVDTGDFNGDGASDFVLGARYANGPADSLRTRCGEVFLYLGDSTGENREEVDLRDGADMILYGASEGDRFGRRILVEDFDQDGKDDLLIAAIGADAKMGQIPDAGAVYLVYGAEREEREGAFDMLEEDFPVLQGLDESDGLGGSVAAGDWNGDGVPDIVLGCGFADGPANGRTNAGDVYVLLGRSGERLKGNRLIAGGSEVTIFGAEEYDGAGVSVGLGDMDGDGIDDIALGANLADGPANGRDKCGEVYVLFGNRSIRKGRTIDLLYPPDIIVLGGEKGDQLGSVLHLFDFNGDSYDDLIISSLLNDGPGEQREDAGMIYVVLGGAQRSLRPRVDLSSDGGDLYLLGPSAGDKIATNLWSGRLAGRCILFASTMIGDGPNDGRLDAGEVYFLQWKNLVGP